jgi:hypothetical protein
LCRPAASVWHRPDEAALAHRLLRQGLRHILQLLGGLTELPFGDRWWGPRRVQRGEQALGGGQALRGPSREQWREGRRHRLGSVLDQPGLVAEAGLVAGLGEDHADAAAHERTEDPVEAGRQAGATRSGPTGAG